MTIGTEEHGRTPPIQDVQDNEEGQDQPRLMGKRLGYHRPLMAGISIIGHPTGGEGTLTGLATLRSDHKKKVLVTNLHILAKPHTTITTAAELYQDTHPAEGRYTPDPDRKVGQTAHWKMPELPNDDGKIDNFLDAAMCELVEDDDNNDVQANYGVHNPDHYKDATKPHSLGTIVEGTKDPVDVEEDALVFVGAVSGKKLVTVREASTTVELPVSGVNFVYRRIMRLTSHGNDFEEGDSGSPVLYQDPDDLSRFHMCGVFFAGDSSNGYAFPASLVETELGITFGNLN